MSTQKALEVIVEMAVVYGVTLEPPALRAWKRVLADADLRDVEAAATAWMRSEKWMPKPSEFMAYIEEARILRIRREAEQWRRWNVLSKRRMTVERRRDPAAMLALADELERSGRESAAAALRVKAEAIGEVVR